MPRPSQDEETRPLTEAEKVLRQALWFPCESKEALGRWIRIYLGVDLPDGHVDATSNSSPLEVLWEIYSKALANDDPGFNSIMVYASRLSFKTLIASIVEVLCLVHLDRDVIHMAAITEQSAKAQEYFNKFFNSPLLRDFRTSKNSTYMEICRYIHDGTGDVISPVEWRELLGVQRQAYTPHTGYIDITPCTMAGTNSKHAAFMVVDEVDVIEGEKVKAYEQAKLIPDEQRGKFPMTLYISTRKTNFGKVQAEIDDAEKSGLVIRHWNIIDVTRPCPASRHEPEKPHVVLYRNDKTLQVITEVEFDRLDENQQKAYEAREAFYGCEHNCRLFGPCEGRLATVRTDRNAAALKKLDIVTTQFRKVGLEMAIAELLCRKPGTEGIIYPALDPTVHLQTAAQLAELITGEHVSEPYYQEQLIELMLSRDMRPVGGIDFGSSHNYAVVLGFTDGTRVYIVEAGSQAELMPDQQVTMAKKYLQPVDAKGNIRYSARIYPDTSSPQLIKVLRAAGLHMVEWNKGPGSVLAGIEAMRVAMGSVVGTPRLLFLRGNERVEFFFKNLSSYHWKKDAAGRPSDVPDEVNDDECFTEDTEALTRNRGWVSLAHVTSSDVVMAVDAFGVGSWETPLEVIHRPYDGPLVGVDHPHLTFTATPDHRHAVMTQYNWKVRGEYVLEKRTVDKMCGEMYWANNLKTWPEGPGYFLGGSDEAWVAGFWLAEGCFDTGRPTYLLLDQTKLQRKLELEEHLAALEWTYSKTYSKRFPGHVRYAISGQGVRATLWKSVFGDGAENKDLPVEVLTQMSARERAALWEGYMAGDGCRTQSCWHFDSVSPKLIAGVQVLTLMLGYGCRVVSYDCMSAGKKMVLGTERSVMQSFRGHVLRRGTVAHVRKDRFVFLPAVKTTVHCVRTSTGQFLARTAGKPFVAGNCDATRYLVMNVLGKYSGLIVAPDAGFEESMGGTAVNIHRQLVGMPGRPVPSSVAVISPEAAKQMHWNQIAGFVGMPTVAPGESLEAVKGSLKDTSHGRKGTFSYDIS